MTEPRDTRRGGSATRSAAQDHREVLQALTGILAAFFMAIVTLTLIGTALPVIMAGLRTALVLLVGTGAFATFIDAGGLGLLIQTGIVLFRFPLLVSGAILVAALALMIEWIGRLVETLATPRGLA